MKNKVEDHPRRVKFSSNKKNRVIEPVCNANVKHSMLNTNFKLICATCNECMFDAIHDMCVLDFVNDVNVHAKSKSSKRSKKKTTWKPTVPPKNPIPTKVTKKTTHRRNNPEMLKDVTNISSSSRSKGVESNVPNNSAPSQNWGSNVSTALSSSLINLILSKLFSGQFCDFDLEVAFHKHTCYIRDLEEAVATTCYTQNRSLIRKSHNKTSYELLHDKKPDLSCLHVFGSLCYTTNDSEDLDKLKPKADIGIFVAGPQLLTPGTISLGLMPNPPSPTPVVSLVPAVVAPEHADSIGTPSLTTIDQDALSISTSQTSQETQAPVIPSGVEEYFHNIEVAHLDNDPFFGVPIPEPNYKESSSRDVIPTNELLPRPDYVMIITLKWIFKVKLDELGGALKNKARLVARGYRQEKGIDFEESFASVARLRL
ncbi:retrovirus-related pol polyprotein from transposon TNT 1-94 [Tanacetum coccineum]